MKYVILNKGDWFTVAIMDNDLGLITKVISFSDLTYAMKYRNKGNFLLNHFQGGVAL